MMQVNFTNSLRRCIIVSSFRDDVIVIVITVALTFCNCEQNLIHFRCFSVFFLSHAREI